MPNAMAQPLCLIELTEENSRMCLAIALKAGFANPEDCAQEALLRAVNKASQFRGTSEREKRAWLTKIVKNVGKNMNRESKAVKRTPCRMDPQEPSPSASTATGRAEENQRLSELVAELSVDEQTFVRLRVVEGLTFEEIAKRMKKSRADTYRNWMEVLKKIRAKTSRSKWSKLL